MKTKFKNLFLLSFTALLGHPVQNIFFALIKKIFSQTLVEIYLNIYIYTSNLENFVLLSFTALLGHPVQNIFFL